MPESGLRALRCVYSISTSLIFIFLPVTSPNHLNSIQCDDFNIMLCGCGWYQKSSEGGEEERTHTQFVWSRNWYTRNCLYLVIFNSIFCGFFFLNRFFTLFWYRPYQHTNTSRWKWRRQRNKYLSSVPAHDNIQKVFIRILRL